MCFKRSFLFDINFYVVKLEKERKMNVRALSVTSILLFINIEDGERNKNVCEQSNN